jgi:hypothetical protein
MKFSEAVLAIKDSLRKIEPTVGECARPAQVKSMKVSGIKVSNMGLEHLCRRT